eukprot:CAMPEP_0116899542 /NCGR_PEP_ID=MMETSP0467-20121206/8083_1 /TAXON_ID=283647 /ORGANISM="Mesodinium pulex, Strain SPMC105" /LENGTH=104 /DNA_ID=CAMNT_0004572411 /DNA_START=372 /DNA_END=686 /DNA_ORIENTATION=-
MPKAEFDLKVKAEADYGENEVKNFVSDTEATSYSDLLKKLEMNERSKKLVWYKIIVNSLVDNNFFQSDKPDQIKQIEDIKRQKLVESMKKMEEMVEKGTILDNS